MTLPARPEPIPFLTLPNWVKAAASCGFNIEPLFRRYGIPSDLVHLENVSVDPLTMEKLMEECIAQARDQHFPFVLGERFAFDYLPDIETFLATSPTLRNATRVFDWVRTLINPMIDIRLEERGQQAHLLIDIRAPDDRASKPYFVESIFAAVHKFFRAMTREQARVGRLMFRHAPPAYAAEYEKFFGIPVRFRCRENAAVFERKLLDAGLSGAFPSLHKQAEYLVEKRLQRMPRKSGAVADLEEAFSRHPELLGQGIAQVSRRLGLEPRTLQRRLQEHRQSFADLQAQARYRMAMQLLEGPQDIEGISERLGFSDRRSFTRAFQRWNGMSPSEFRARRTR